MGIFFIVIAVLIAGSVLAWVITYLVNLNSDLAKAKENEILNREIMKKQEKDIQARQKKQLESRTGAAYDSELELLIKAQRYDDALQYIEERRRLAFEQGNNAREEMYRRYRENIEFETRDRSQEGF